MENAPKTSSLVYPLRKHSTVSLTIRPPYILNGLGVGKGGPFLRFEHKRLLGGWEIKAQLLYVVGISIVGFSSAIHCGGVYIVGFSYVGICLYVSQSILCGLGGVATQNETTYIKETIACAFTYPI